MIICLRISGMHIPILDIWSDVQTRVGTPHKILREAGGGTPRIPIEIIWSDVETRVGTPHKVIERYCCGHWTTFKEPIHKPCFGGWLLKCYFRSHSGSHQNSAWFQNPSLNRVWQCYIFRTQSVPHEMQYRGLFGLAFGEWVPSVT